MLVFLLPSVLIVGGLCILPIWHWTRQDVAFFDRTGIAHSTWKTLFTVGLFGFLPLIGVAWWLAVLRDQLRGRRARPAS